MTMTGYLPCWNLRKLPEEKISQVAVLAKPLVIWDKLDYQNTVATGIWRRDKCLVRLLVTKECVTLMSQIICSTVFFEKRQDFG